MGIVIVDSAHKHGISDYSINTCILNKIADELIEDEPEKRLVVGFDQNGKTLEIIGIMKDDTFILTWGLIPRRLRRLESAALTKIGSKPPI